MISFRSSQLLLPSIIFIFSCAVSDPSDLAPPSGLSVELIRQPNKASIVDEGPEYAWHVPQNLGMQQSYQILVASSKEVLDDDQGDIWDSGPVVSGRSFDIEHAGEPLQTGRSYYWKVRISGEEGRTTPFSKAQKFSYEPASQMITTPNLFQMDGVSPAKFEQKEGGTYFIDFGKAAFGTVVLRLETDRADTLTVRLGEQITTSGDINREPIGHIRYQEEQLILEPGTTTHVLKLTPDRRNTLAKAVALPDSFPVVLPFRYCEIEGASDALSADDITQLAFHTYFEEGRSHFTSTDTILNQVWDLCKYSMKATSFAGYYVDGDRERIPYEADAYINQLSHYAVDAEYAIARRTIEYFMEKPTWPTEWQLHVALMFHADYMYTGNNELIEKYYEPLKHKALTALAREDGLITTDNVTSKVMRNLGFKDPKDELRDIVDWPPAGWGGDPNVPGERDNYDFRPINTVINSFYYRNLQILAEFADLMDKPTEAEDYRNMARQVKMVLNEKLFDEERGVYIDGEGSDHAALHANMLPLAFGLVPAEHRASVIDFIRSRGMACSVYAAQYLMDGLYEEGEQDYGLELMTATHDRSWWNMIAIGSTISLEAWDMKYKPNADWNHAWGAVPANTIVRQMWGIRPKTPGGDVVVIAPQLSTLTSTEISVPFLSGNVEARYQKEGETSTYEISIPGNVMGEFQLLGEEGKTITRNGETLREGTTSTQLVPGRHRLEVRSFQSRPEE